MQLRAHELPGRASRGLASVYVISGDEPLQKAEAVQTVRDAALSQGFAERLSLTASTGFDWMELKALNDSMSLFSDRRLIELNLPSGKPGDAGSKALVGYCERANPDNVLVVIAPRLDPATRRSKWYKMLESSGAAVQIWPIDSPRLPQWLSQRAGRHGLSLSGDAARLLAERVEGNLVAADQELQKLSLLHADQDNAPAHIDAESVLAAVAASSRYNVSDVVEAALGASGARASKVMHSLRDEGVEPVVLVFVLSREVQSIRRMKTWVDTGMPIPRALDQERVWDKRKRIVGQALGRLSPDSISALLAKLALADRVAKGAAPGSIWDILEQVALGLAGIKVTDDFDV